MSVSFSELCTKKITVPPPRFSTCYSTSPPLNALLLSEPRYPSPPPPLISEIMSAAQYEKWSKYNVEDSLAEVDSKSLVDDRDRKLNKLSVTQATLESSTITENETLALSHTSAAAVDQLKSVRKGRSARKKASGPMVPPPPTPESLKATRASVRAKSLASACAAREAGKVAASEKRYSASLTLFEEGSGFLDVFEENGEPVPVDPSKPEGAVVGNSSSKGE